MTGCTQSVRDFYEDEYSRPCGDVATTEGLATSGIWTPICERHAEGVPAARLRALSQRLGLDRP